MLILLVLQCKFGLFSIIFVLSCSFGILVHLQYFVFSFFVNQKHKFCYFVSAPQILLYLTSLFYLPVVILFLPSFPFLLFSSDLIMCNFQNRDFCLMVIGVPNVGKSSLINSLRRTNLKKGIQKCMHVYVTCGLHRYEFRFLTNASGRASQVGGEPGITRAVLTKIQVCSETVWF